jgi:DNA repair protein RadC
MVPICTEQAGIGGSDSVAATLRDIAKIAILASASAIALVHNHPSGDPRPSQEDIHITQAVAMGMQLLQIALYDHIIIGSNGKFYSIHDKKGYKAV